MALPTDVSYAMWLAENETTVQENVVLAQHYYDGLHDVKLTARQKEFLGYNTSDGWRFALNYCNIVVDAMISRMLLKGVLTADGNEAVDEWARQLLKVMRLDAVQNDVHRGAVRDGEHFVLVDWDKEHSRPRLSPHPRYTDGLLDGSGYGCKAHYPDDDPTLPMEYASKRWTERQKVESDRTRVVQRMNLYYPSRVEEYELAGGGNTTDWTQTGAKPWVDQAGQPLGIPVFHYRHPGGKSKLWDAIPIQDAINKTALDILAIADTNGWGFMVAKGFTPTTDGKNPESDGSNYLNLHVGMWIGPLDPAADIERIQGEDPTPLVNLLDSLIFKLAQVTDTPISRFQVGQQVRAEGSIQQQEEPLIARVRECETVFGNAWEDAIAMALRLQNQWGESVGGDLEGLTFESDWEPPQTRDQMAEEKAFWEAAKMAGEAGVPLTAFLELQGWDQARIDKIVNNPEHQARLAMQQAAIQNFGAQQQDENG